MERIQLILTILMAIALLYHGYNTYRKRKELKKSSLVLPGIFAVLAIAFITLLITTDAEASARDRGNIILMLTLCSGMAVIEGLKYLWSKPKD